MTARSSTLTVAVAVTLLLSPATSQATEVCEQGVCIEGADWDNGASLDDSARAREAKRNRKRKDATLSVELVGSGRGSVFLDGVWIAPAPISYVPLKPGKHDLEVRDGETVLARGVLEIPRKGGEVKVKVSR